MSLCARAVALWLAACALAARAQVEVPQPQCPHVPLRVCREDGYHESERYGHEYRFEVHGQHHSIYVHPKGMYQARCLAAQLGDPAWPRFESPTRLDPVVLDCAPPAGSSYGAALKALNIIPAKRLFISIPVGSHVNATAFADMPSSVTELGLSPVEQSGSLDLDPGTLAELDYVRNLTLHKVRVDAVPPGLDELILFTDTDVLPRNALNAKILSLSERFIKSIRGYIPRMIELNLKGLPRLHTLVLYDAKSLQLSDEFLYQAANVEVVSLHNVRALTLPKALLLGAPVLTHFTYTMGKIKALDEDFFSYTPRLQVIDLSHNDLGKLPMKLFSNLPELRELRLVNNNLTVNQLEALAPLTECHKLTVLDLSGNPLSRLCHGGVLTTIQSLRELYLARTNLAQICGNIISDLPALQYLDLKSNDITLVYCTHLRKPLGSHTVVDLRENNFKMRCLHDYESDNAVLAKSFKQLKLLSDLDVDCDCCPYVQCEDRGAPTRNFNDI